MFSISLESFEVKEFEEEYKKFVVAVNDFAEDIFSDPCLWLAEAEFRVLYQINGIIIVLFFLICYSKHMKNTKHGVLPHFSIEALKQRYLACECPRERMRWHAIWLLADTEHPRTPREVADIVAALLTAFGNFVGTITPMVKRHCKTNEKLMEGVPSLMRHSKHPLKKHFRHRLLMAGSGQVPKLRLGYLGHCSGL